MLDKFAAFCVIAFIVTATAGFVMFLIELRDDNRGRWE